MRTYLTAVLVALGLLVAAPVAAEASDGYTTGDVNMRAGPGTQYPRILVITRGTPVTIHGCLEGYSWCDVSVWRERGWVSSRYLDAFYRNQAYVPYRPQVQVPIIAFGFGYWDRWYYDRPWYRSWRYDNVRPGRPGWRDDDRPIRNDRVYVNPDRPVRRDDVRPGFRNDNDRNDRPTRNDRVYVNPDRPARLGNDVVRPGRPDRNDRNYSNDDGRGAGQLDNRGAGNRNDRSGNRGSDNCVWRNGVCVTR